LSKLTQLLIREKTHRVLTWQGRLVVVLAFLIVGVLSWPLIRLGITSYIYQVDPLRPAPRIIVENWDGDVEMFENSLAVSRSAGAVEIWSIIFEDSYVDNRKRHAYILNAWAAGIDTTSFFLIPVLKQDPKTVHIARAVTDTAHQHGWGHLTIVTWDIHSARSRKAYILAGSPYGISITTIGVSLEGVTSTNWHTSSTGLSSAFSETIKKLYYDLVVF
jgi:hypothetical protein